MKKIFVILFAISIILSCSSGPSEFVSEENGIKITFPCSYKNYNAASHGCGNPLPEAGKELVEDYSVQFSNFDKEKWNRRLSYLKADARKAKINKEKYKHWGVATDITFSEKKINGYKAYEETKTDTSRSEGVERIEKRLFVIKNGKFIEIFGLLIRPPDMSQEDFNKIVETDFEGFFNSLEVK